MADEQSTGVSEDQLDDSVVDDADDMSWGDVGEDKESETLEEELDTDLEEPDEPADEDEPEAEAESEDTTDDEEEAEEESSDEPQDEEATRKQEARERYEARQAEKQARENRIREAQAQFVAEASQGEDPLATAVAQLQVDAYNNTVRSNETTLTTEYQRAAADFNVLRSDDPAVRAEIDSAIDAFQAQYVKVDQYGNPVEVRGDLYSYLQAKADSITRLTGIREQKQETAKAKQKSKSITPPSRTAREPKVDPELAAFDEEAGW